ncbi:hypothetical protein Vadar_000264 [Vaccinium darrowii]|uniref:Uncharacterized protein n=1 Tax=Vaccinium darrowii TaxID=229202 RepID=A0ACB7YB59_9ERIC|nr:hypothetical protein Vadar_000264 [Vaccinium darrowii]
MPVPTWLRHIQEVKLRHKQVLRLVKTLCETISNSAYGDASYYKDARYDMVRAIFAGIPEIIEEIANHFPGLVLETHNRMNFFQWAIVDRNERVFNLVYQMTYHQHVTGALNCNGYNILHLAGRAPPPNSPVRFPALQVQRELQWFEEVKKFVHPEFREFRNADGHTPQELFTKEHKDLVAEGGKWLKETANSCTVPAALIITVAFAAAITIPGGNNGRFRTPNFLRQSGIHCLCHFRRNLSLHGCHFSVGVPVHPDLVSQRSRFSLHSSHEANSWTAHSIPFYNNNGGGI